MLTHSELDAIRQSLRDIDIILTKVSKRFNAHNSRLKAKDNGSKLGRKKQRDDEKIHRLRNKGMSIRAIAKVCGVSTASVQRSLNTN